MKFLPAVVCLGCSLTAWGQEQAKPGLDETRSAAEQGDADAQYNLGLRYHYGEGVPQDDAEAVKWWRLAAEQGDATAQRNLGLMYRDGEGVLKDYAEAVKWSSLAAKQGRRDGAAATSA